MSSAPVVQNLEQILAELEPGYAGVRNVYAGQQAGLGAKYDAQRAGVEGKKVQGFQDIARSANTRNLDFWGIPVEEQAQYLSDVYLPGMMQANNQQNDENTQLNLAMAQLEQQKLQRGQDTRGQQQSAYSAWVQEQERRAWEAEQARLEREARARESALDRSSKYSSEDNSDPTAPFIQQFSQFISQNKNKATRQAQDKYINSLFNSYGIKDKASRQIVWDAINANFKRTGDPTKDRLWKR